MFFGVNLAQQTPAKKQTESILITDITLHVGNGKILENSFVGFENGIINYISSSYPQSDYDIVIDGTNKHVYPGFIALNTSLGLGEIDAVRATIDEDEIGEGYANQFERSGSTSKFDVANTKSKGAREDNRGLWSGTERVGGGETTEVSNTDSEGLARRWSECELREGQEEGQIGWSQWWQSEPNVGRVANGIPKRVDRLKSLGNSLVPMIPYYIGMSIKKGDMLWTK